LSPVTRERERESKVNIIIIIIVVGRSGNQKTDVKLIIAVVGVLPVGRLPETSLVTYVSSAIIKTSRVSR